MVIVTSQEHTLQALEHNKINDNNSGPVAGQKEEEPERDARRGQGVRLPLAVRRSSALHRRSVHMQSLLALQSRLRAEVQVLAQHGVG